MGKCEKQKKSAKANGLTTQSDKNKKWSLEPTKKNGVYSEKTI